VKYGLIPQNPLEGAALALGIVPTPLADTLVAIWLARSVMVATKLGVFEALADGPLGSAEVADRCHTDPRATRKLLDALVPTGYLRLKNSRYALSRTASRWLLKDAGASLHDAMLHRFLDWQFAEHFEDFVRSGEPLDFHAKMASEQWSIYQRGMRAHAAIAAPEVARRTPMPRGATAMLDLGGGHGLFAAALCRRHPRLCATVLDLPEAVAAAAPLLAAEGLGDRLVHRPSDALTDDLGEAAYDLVFLANLLHHFDEPTCRALVARAARALRPSGCLVIHELIRPACPDEAGTPGSLADLYFAATSRSGTWSFAELTTWLRAAGLAPRRPIRLLSVPGLGQVAGCSVAGRDAGQPVVR
jgi:SAM-dependent methyltransferase